MYEFKLLLFLEYFLYILEEAQWEKGMKAAQQKGECL